jgi:hypothetical protein
MRFFLMGKVLGVARLFTGGIRKIGNEDLFEEKIRACHLYLLRVE